jgi:hypothetical protein
MKHLMIEQNQLAVTHQNVLGLVAMHECVDRPASAPGSSSRNGALLDDRCAVLVVRF